MEMYRLTNSELKRNVKLRTCDQLKLVIAWGKIAQVGQSVFVVEEKIQRFYNNLEAVTKDIIIICLVIIQ